LSAYSLEYTVFPNVTLTPHHAGYCCINVNQGHWWATCSRNDIGSQCCATVFLDIVALRSDIVAKQFGPTLASDPTVVGHHNNMFQQKYHSSCCCTTITLVIQDAYLLEKLWHTYTHTHTHKEMDSPIKCFRSCQRMMNIWKWKMKYYRHCSFQWIGRNQYVHSILCYVKLGS
jgi:hypothetical protein